MATVAVKGLSTSSMSPLGYRYILSTSIQHDDTDC